MRCASTEENKSDSFDVITACQCFWYFDHEHVMPKLAELLKQEGRLLILYMAWLPEEDDINIAKKESITPRKLIIYKRGCRTK